MKTVKLLLALLAVLSVLTLPGWAQACPSCAEAPAAGSGDDENIAGNQAAYNNSIYLMVGVPYLTLGIGVFLIYRGLKKNEAFRQSRGWMGESPAAPGQHAWAP